MPNITKTDPDFQKRFENWKKQFNEADNPCLPLAWRGNWLENGWCAKCRYCCGPQGSDEPFPMPLLPSQVEPDNSQDFYMLDENTAYIGAEGCKSDTSTGCRLPASKKPIACGLFPIVLANGKLYLYQNCPSVIFTPLARFFKIAENAAAMLSDLHPDELRRISIELPENILAEKYIDLHIKLFEL